jgi:hypothetical protein
VQVLQQGAWEIDKTKFDRIILKPFLQKCMDDFNTFYIQNHKTHKLTWAYGLGTLEIQYLKLDKKYISVSTLIQYMILVTLEKYEKEGKMPVSKIAEILGVNQNTVAYEANALLYHMSFNPKKDLNAGLILTDLVDVKSTDGKPAEKPDIKPETQIWSNEKFQCQNLKINTIPFATKKTPDQSKKEEEDEIRNLKAYRNIIIDSTITRIMKGRIGQKTTHAFLVNDVAKQIELFQAQPPMIKERIECLIEKQIIKRNDADRNAYDYVA